MSNKTEGETLVLDYDLFGLPTAQHKAGLAGLILLIDSMNARKLSPVPIAEYDATTARISFTRESMKTIFNDLYKGIAVTTKKGDEKIRPALEYLSIGFGMPCVWIHAWQDCIMSVIRKGRALKIYETGYDGQQEYMRLYSNYMASSDFDASLIIPGEAQSAEKIHITGMRANNFLLHFCLIPSLVFVPSFIVKETNPKTKTSEWVQSFNLNNKRRGPFFTLVIPEPSNLIDFVKDAKAILRHLSSDIYGYRPKEAVINIPAEGGLEYLYYFVQAQMKKQDIDEALLSVDIYYMEQQGKIIRTLTSERIIPSYDVLENYDALRKSCHNPLFKGQRIRNLLAGESWYRGMDTIFNQYPLAFFVNNKDSPHMPFFGNDVVRKYRALENQVQFIKGGGLMNDETGDAQLALCVRRLIRKYVYRKSEDKSGVKYEKIKDHKDDKGRIIYPLKYLEALENTCGDAFLAMRSRRDNDFVEYFTGSICSVPQYLPQNDYLLVSQFLLSDWERVKTLAMLALSSVSQVGGHSEESEKGEEK